MNLHHTGLSVLDLDRAKKWYADVLGMTEGYAFEIPPANIRGCFVQGAGGRVELIERTGSEPGIGGQDPSAALLTHGYGHIAFTTQDLDETFADLVAKGATPVWDPRPSPQPGVRMAFIADIDGNLIEVMEAVEGKTI
jgi:catechol 2,3-dioxygenase-like lactoylglutathione lyase family enzyme